MKHLFVSATGTEVGKTWFTRGLVQCLVHRGFDVAALKPFETDVAPEPRDARTLAAACGKPELADLPGLYRVPPPLAPLAATLEGHPPPDLEIIAARLEEAEAEYVIAEGAGGIAVPLTEERDTADFVAQLGWPVILVAQDGLGVLSYTITAYHHARARGVDVLAVVLMQHAPARSQSTNRQILASRLDAPIFVVPPSSEGQLARRIEASGVVDSLVTYRN